MGRAKERNATNSMIAVMRGPADGFRTNRFMSACCVSTSEAANPAIKISARRRPLTRGPQGPDPSHHVHQAVRDTVSAGITSSSVTRSSALR